MEHLKLLEFLCELIDIQIKKYESLTRIGIGPDASMNALLVTNEVQELFLFADELMGELQKPEESRDKEKFASLFNQVRFYADEEYRRGYAGWLLDENSIHTPETARLDIQRSQLKKLAEEAKIDYAPFSQPANEAQMQCQYDSYSIAHFILNIVVELKADPNKELGYLPAHAARVIKAHIQDPNGRYHNNWGEIERLHKECSHFLETSNLSKTRQILTKKDVVSFQERDSQKLSDILSKLKELCPDSSLFKETHQWYEIGEKQRVRAASEALQRTPAVSGGISSAMFSAVATGLVAMLTIAFAFYLQWEKDQSLTSLPNLKR